jgi:hypothetical protein
MADKVKYIKKEPRGIFLPRVSYRLLFVFAKNCLKAVKVNSISNEAQYSRVRGICQSKWE